MNKVVKQLVTYVVLQTFSTSLSVMQYSAFVIFSCMKKEEKRRRKFSVHRTRQYSMEKTPLKKSLRCANAIINAWVRFLGEKNISIKTVTFFVKLQTNLYQQQYQPITIVTTSNVCVLHGDNAWTVHTYMQFLAAKSLCTNLRPAR